MSNQYSNLYIYAVLLLLIYPAFSYFVPDDATAGSWQSAQTQCANAGSTLATVPGFLYHAGVYPGSATYACRCYCEEQTIQLDDCRCWIGLRANLATDPFTYDDGTMININSYGFSQGNRPATQNSGPWATSDPSENNNANICVYTYYNDNSWYDTNCNGEPNNIYPVCNGDKTTGCQADCTLCVDKEECSNSRLICAYAEVAVGGTGCVPQSDTPFVAIDIESEGFNEAVLYCQSLGGNLASIHSELENQWAVSLCESISEPSSDPEETEICFIGLRYIQGPEWEWIDGTPFDYGMANDFGVYPSPPWDDLFPEAPNRCNRFMGNQMSLKDDPQEKGRGCIGFIFNDANQDGTAWGDDYTDAVDTQQRPFICRIPTLSPTTSPSHPSKYPTLKPTDDEEGASSD